MSPQCEGRHSANPNGLKALFDLHRRELLRFLAARCGAPDLAEDLLHDLWLKLDRGDAGPVSNGRAYLFRMANNLVLDAARGRSRAMRRDKEWLSAEGAAFPVPEDRPDPACSADELVVLKQEVQALRRAIETLPQGARRALWLYRMEERGQADVARVMGISRSGVEKHLTVAMRHLRKILGEAELLPPSPEEQDQ